MNITRRHFFLGSLALPAFAAKKPVGEQPNILLILVEGLPSWILGCYGNTRGPHAEHRPPGADRHPFPESLRRALRSATRRASTLLTGRTPCS